MTAADVPAENFIAPRGEGRCLECGWHEATQGHREGCSEPPVLTANAAAIVSFLDKFKTDRRTVQHAPAAAPLATTSSADDHPWVEAAMRHELAALRATPEGGRNDALGFRLSRTLP